MRLTASLALTATQQNQIVNVFRTASAVSGQSARRLRDLGLNSSKPLQGLVTAMVVRKAGAERYYLDEQVWAARRSLKGRTVARLALAAGLVAALLVWLGT